MKVSTSSSDLLCKWIFEFADFGIILTDKKLNIIDVNRWIKIHSDEQKTSLKGSSIFKMFPEIREQGMDHHLNEALKGTPVILETRLHGYLLKLRTDSGSEMKQTVRISPMLNEDFVTGLIIHIEDVTERVNLEEEKHEKNEELQRFNSSKDKFFRIVSHDIRSPFVAILGLSDILKDDDSLTPEKRKEIFGMIHTSIKNLYTFHENLLKWVQLKTGLFELDFSEVSLKEVIGQVIAIADPVIKSKKIEIITSEIHEEMILTDRQALTSVLYNIIFNALKFTGQGGRIEIVTIKKHDTIIISVNDNGVGISEERIAKLFRIDESVSTPGTNRERGSGLGLILVKELIDKLGGKIWVDSIPGKGSTFYVSLPVKRE